METNINVELAVYILSIPQLVVRYEQGALADSHCGITVTDGNWETGIRVALKARSDFRFDGEATRTVNLVKRDIQSNVIGFQSTLATLTVRFMDHSQGSFKVWAPQWEDTLLCITFSHWPSTYPYAYLHPEWSLICCIFGSFEIHKLWREIMLCVLWIHSENGMGNQCW